MYAIEKTANEVQIDEGDKRVMRQARYYVVSAKASKGFKSFSPIRARTSRVDERAEKGQARQAANAANIDQFALKPINSPSHLTEG